MRKALIGLVLAATVLTPAAALAQRHGARSHDDGETRAEQRAERVQQRSEARQERQEARQQRQQAAPQPQQQQQQQQQYVQRNRGGDGNRGDGNRNWRGADGNRGGDRGGRNTQQSVYPQAWQGNPNDPRLQHYRELERRNQQQGDRGDWRRDRRDDRRGDRQDWRRDGRNDRGDWRGDRRGDRRDWNGDWRNDRRYDWRSWRNSNRNIFRGSRYYSPYRDWNYQRFSIGIFLEPLFYSQNYWIGDPWQYRLPPAYPGTQWVRYYNDVLLVDTYTGEVIDVIYDFFW